MTFAQIERVVGAKLPPSQHHRAWWSNNPWNNVMTKVWLDAGFVTEQVDIEGKKLVFRRAATKGRPGLQEENMPFDATGKSAMTRHPLFGALKGSMRIAAGVDLTTPAIPEWRRKHLTWRVASARIPAPSFG